MTIKKIILPYLIIFLGFVFLLFYFSWSDMQFKRRFVREQELPSLGLAISSKLEQMAWQYQKAGESLLQDNFIRDWIQTKNSDIDSLILFMENVRGKFAYDLIDASIVNDLNETYYATTGEIIKLDPKNKERDGWYYTYREMVDGTNLDSWFYSDDDVFGLFVNVPIISKSGKYLGVVGGGIDATQFMNNLNSFNTKHNINMFLIRQDGALVYTQDSQFVNSLNLNASSLWGVSTFESIVRNRSNIGGVLLEGETKPNSVFWSIYLDDWNTYLVIERNTIPASVCFFQNLFEIIFSVGFLILFLSIITAYHVKSIWSKTIQQVYSYKGTIQKLSAIKKTQDCLLRDAESSLLSLGSVATKNFPNDNRGKDAIEKSLYIQECRGALQRYAQYNKTTTFGSSVTLEKIIIKLLESLSAELSRKNIRITAYNTDSKTQVQANALILSLVIETLLLNDLDCEEKTKDIFLSVNTYKGKPSIDISGLTSSDLIHDKNIQLQKSLLKEQNAYIETSGENPENLVFHIYFESGIENRYPTPRTLHI